MDQAQSGEITPLAERRKFARQRRLWRGLLWLCIVVVGLILVLTLIQRRLLYFPQRVDEAAAVTLAEAAAMQPVRDEQGHIIAWQYLPENPPTHHVIVFHGNAGMAVLRDYFVDAFASRNTPKQRFAVTILEYPGYGPRPGRPSEASIIAAAEQLTRRITQNTDARIILLGESLGAAVAVRLASQMPDPVAGLILVTPFNNLADVAQHHFPILPVWWILRDRYASDEHILDYGGPVVILLSGRDRVVPVQFGEALHEIYPGPKKLILDETAGHNDVNLLPTAPWWTEALHFIESYDEAAGM